MTRHITAGQIECFIKQALSAQDVVALLRELEANDKVTRVAPSSRWRLRESKDSGAS